MRYERVKVKRDTNTVHNRAVPPWEIPILEFLFDDGNIERLEIFEEVAGEYPTPAKELDRLVRCYGADPKSGVPYANSVYGNARAGERSLAKLIDEAKAEDSAATEKTPIPAAVSKRRGRPAKADAAESLLS
jgi:hypothetical protein